MPFDSRYEEAAENELVGNLIEVTKRDMPDALEHFYTGQGLVTFAQVTDGEIDRFKYPLLVLGVQAVTSSETDAPDEAPDEAVFLNQVITVGAAIAVTGASRTAVPELLRKYVRTFKSVVRSAAASDLLPATARVLTHTIDINHRYFKVAQNEAGAWAQAVEMEIKFRFGEN